MEAVRPRIVIAAARSGSGKTTVTSGIAAALAARGLRVHPFKVGPDYIDPGYLALAAGSRADSLDSWLTGEDTLKKIFISASADSDIAVIEGVMGLYDGYDRWKGSSAEMASILDLPVLLIVNARSMAYSAAAVIHGFTSLSCEDLPSLRFAGVIFNQVGSERHASFLKQACEDAGTVCLGCIPRLPDMEIPSRHLGLSLENRDFIEQIICRAADAVEQYVDLKALGL